MLHETPADAWSSILNKRIDNIDLQQSLFSRWIAALSPKGDNLAKIFPSTEIILNKRSWKKDEVKWIFYKAAHQGGGLLNPEYDCMSSLRECLTWYIDEISKAKRRSDQAYPTNSTWQDQINIYDKSNTDWLLLVAHIIYM